MPNYETLSSDIYVEVMYGDQSRKKVILQDANNDTLLPKTDVLFIVLTTNEKPRSRKNLIDRVWGKDTYGIHYNSESIFLHGWDDGDEVFRTRLLSNPHIIKEEKRHYDNMPEKSILFKGVWIPTDKWDKSLELFNKEMY